MNRFFTIILLLFATSASAQIQLTGKVVEQQSQEPLTGATVRLKNTFTASTTNAKGEFNLSTPSGDDDKVLVVSFIGYETKELTSEQLKKQPILVELKKSFLQKEEVVISAYRADEKTGMAISTLDAMAIKQSNTGVDIPIMLNQIPSAVTNSDAGAGIGYTGIRIRGSDGTRINVTMNGIPVNDAESHGVFWVNMPDLASSTNSIQVQRGVGTSTNGAAAFGASINLNTNESFSKSFSELTNGFGSFNTFRHSFKLGLAIPEKEGTESALWNVEARLSKITSDGYIDRAFSDLKSFYTSAARIGKKSVFRLNVFSGREQTYQAWYGIPQDIYQINRRFNSAGQYFDANGNEKFYENETDNYQQDHYQAFYTYELNKNWTFNTAFHYTYGRGYFEQYRYQDDLSRYGAEPIVINSDTISTSDLIRRRWLDNHFYGQVFSFIYSKKKLNWVTGGGWNIYSGRHFGEVIWAQWANQLPLNSIYYDNDARKTDLNIYSRASYDWNESFSTFADLQFRHIDYTFLGFNQDLENVTQNARFPFFNPKAGLNYIINQKHSVYASVSVGQREPTRDDFTQSSTASRPKPERLTDFEAGYRFKRGILQTTINAFYMNYRDQLVLTGAINDVGAYIRSNVDRSFRRGMEWEWTVNASKKINVSGNLALSENKIVEFTEFLDDYDTFEQIAIQRTNTDISFSPAVIGGLTLHYKLNENWNVFWIHRYVGRQYLDNTSAKERSLDPFYVSDLRINAKPLGKSKQTILSNIEINALVANVFDAKYAPNGYTFSGLINGVRNDFNFLYPMAGRNFMLNITIKL